MYNITAYGKMIADAPRMEAYASALRRAVRPDSTVLDLGCGPGLFALLACEFGARRVYAVEPDDVVQLAREAAAANGFSDRIVFLQSLSTRVTLSEQADVIISDLRGVLPWFQQHLPSIRDARRRLLAPDGVLIPGRDLLWAAVAEVPDEYSKLIAPWENNRWRFDLAAARNLVTNTWSKARVDFNRLLVEPVCWAKLDYYQFDTPDIRAEITWTVTRGGTAHALIVWFDSELAEGIWLSNRPGEPELIYGQALFPLSQPIDVAAGDRIKIDLSADLVGDDYVWRWHTRISGKEQIEKADFKQSTFFGTPLSIAQLRKRAANFVPTLNEEGQVYALILHLMDGKTPLEKIALQVSERFPATHAVSQNALDKVSEVSQSFSR